MPTLRRLMLTNLKKIKLGKTMSAVYNIYKAKDGKVVLVQVNKDSGLSNVETGMTWDEVLEDYPAKKKGAETDASVEEIAEEIQE